jgi:hypothetical protein
MQAWTNYHYAASCSVKYVARQILHLMPLVSLVTEGREFPTSDSPLAELFWDFHMQY